jgi:hypothetical protein
MDGIADGMSSINLDEQVPDDEPAAVGGIPMQRMYNDRQIPCQFGGSSPDSTCTTIGSSDPEDDEGNVRCLMDDPNTPKVLSDALLRVAVTRDCSEAHKIQSLCNQLRTFETDLTAIHRSLIQLVTWTPSNTLFEFATQFEDFLHRAILTRTLVIPHHDLITMANRLDPILDTAVNYVHRFKAMVILRNPPEASSPLPKQPFKEAFTEILDQSRPRPKSHYLTFLLASPEFVSETCEEVQMKPEIAPLGQGEIIPDAVLFGTPFEKIRTYFDLVTGVWHHTPDSSESAELLAAREFFGLVRESVRISASEI